MVSQLPEEIVRRVLAEGSDPTVRLVLSLVFECSGSFERIRSLFHAQESGTWHTLIHYTTLATATQTSPVMGRWPMNYDDGSDSEGEEVSRDDGVLRYGQGVYKNKIHTSIRHL